MVHCLNATLHVRETRASYFVTVTSVTPVPGGSVSFDPITSQANLIAFRIGIAIGV